MHPPTLLRQGQGLAVEICRTQTCYVGYLCMAIATPVDLLRLPTGSTLHLLSTFLAITGPKLYHRALLANYGNIDSVVPRLRQTRSRNVTVVQQTVGCVLRAVFEARLSRMRHGSGTGSHLCLGGLTAMVSKLMTQCNDGEAESLGQVGHLHPYEDAPECKAARNTVSTLMTQDRSWPSRAVPESICRSEQS
ncbi:hypothetical protein EXIGLDRAFT_346758 [Exidia glandulosa HHB12029]|uniref:Uncharacterized protein n=1 Tax=Exidia glandulosa HHB12029 TaxID=1314781 RepID=A0A165CG05_EXIGL|nr:hypothetical protein EXIGLDRAFT_346758 [Exidia glandulosa HHB12029]